MSAEEIKEMQAVSNAADGSNELHAWLADDGKWYTSFSGTYRGIYSESDDLEVEGCENLNGAIEDVKIRYQEWHLNN